MWLHHRLRRAFSTDHDKENGRLRRLVSTDWGWPYQTPLYRLYPAFSLLYPIRRVRRPHTLFLVHSLLTMAKRMLDSWPIPIPFFGGGGVLLDQPRPNSTRRKHHFPNLQKRTIEYPKSNICPPGRHRSGLHNHPKISTVDDGMIGQKSTYTGHSPRTVAFEIPKMSSRLVRLVAHDSCLAY